MDRCGCGDIDRVERRSEPSVQVSIAYYKKRLDT